MRFAAAVAAIAVGCARAPVAAQDDAEHGEHATGDDSVDDPTPSEPSGDPSADTGSPGDDEPEADLDCTFALGEVSRVADHTLLVFEDFELLADGRVATGANNYLMAYTDWGAEMEMLGFGLGINPTGVRALADGTIAVADVSEGTVSRVDPTSGGVEVLVGGMSNPNGLTAAGDGLLYVSEHVDGGRVLRVDPATGEVATVTTFPADEAPNGIALEPGDDTLVVAVRAGAGGSRIDRIDLTTGAATEVAAFDGELDTVGVDACGGVYTVPYGGGAVSRIAPSGEVTDLVTIDLGAISGMRWGIGTAALPRDHLYVSAQHNGVTEIAVGVTGAPTVF
ncbi:MAG: hypothetical protein ABMB14_33630 [Myxococcota bacterium]